MAVFIPILFQSRFVFGFDLGTSRQQVVHGRQSAGHLSRGGQTVVGNLPGGAPGSAARSGGAAGDIVGSGAAISPAEKTSSLAGAGEGVRRRPSDLTGRLRPTSPKKPVRDRSRSWIDIFAGEDRSAIFAGGIRRPSSDLTRPADV